MKSPRNISKNKFYEGANVEWEIENNFTRIINSQKFESSEDFFGNFSLEDEFNLEKKFDEFIGDSEDSTEISLIVSNLSLSNTNSDNTNQENDSENTEIFNIMNRNQNIPKNILPCRKTFERAENSGPEFLVPVKKISMTGRVLKSPIIANGDEIKSDTPIKKPKVIKINHCMKMVPERTSKPMNSNIDFNDTNKIIFTRKLQIASL